MRACSVALSLILVVSACSTTSRPSIRALPTTLSEDAAKLLAGCEVLESTWDFEARCGTLAIAHHARPPSLEPAWLGLATDRGYSLGARTSWSDRALLTDAGPVPLREARFIAVEGDGDLGFLMGVSRERGTTLEDHWCAGDRADADNIGRCEAVLTALLQPPATTAGIVPADGRANPDGVTATTTATTATPARLRGRALSLPTTCGVQSQDDRHGAYRCPDVALAWRVTDDMDAAAHEAEALLASLAADEVAVPLPCRLGYEASVCRGTDTVVVGTAFVDGVALIATCIARDEGNARAAPPCKTLLNGSW